MDEDGRSKRKRKADKQGHLYRRTSGWLIATLASTVLAFIAATTFGQFRAAIIHDRASHMATVIAPSIEYAARARADLQRAESLITVYLSRLEAPSPNVSPPEVDLAEIDRLRRMVRQNVDAYLALPIIPGEELYRDRIREESASIDEAIGRIADLVQAGDAVAVRRVLHADVIPRAESLGNALVGAIDVNGESVRSAAQGIDRSRQDTVRIAYLLDGLCVVLAIMAGLMALRAIKGYAALVEEQKRRLEHQNEELDLFASRVAHDIRGPLTPVRIAIERGCKTAPDELSKKVFIVAARSMERVDALIAGLLEYARAGASVDAEARANIADVARGVLEDEAPNARAAHIEMRLELEELPPVRCSSAVLASILTNLVRNAVKYMGEATVRVVTVRATATEGRVRIEVRDTGQGFSPDIGERLFEPYVRGDGTRAPGLGLGLATVKRLVIGHGGKVGVDAKPGAGACFWVELPLAG